MGERSQSVDLDGRFEWDELKNKINVEKHGIAFEYATEAFSDPQSLDYRSRGDHNEGRCVLIGAVQGRLLAVIYTIRAGRIRIISARIARREERKLWIESGL